MTVSAPQRVAQRHLLDLLLDRGGDRRVADVGVDLHQEVAADDHRLALGMVDVGRDDRAPARRPRRARTRAPCPPAAATNSISGGDLAPPRVVHLGHPVARLGAQAPAAARARLHVGAGEDPVTTERRQALLHVGRVVGIGVEPARVVEPEALAVRERDLADRNAHRGIGAGHIDLSVGHAGPPFAGITQFRFVAVGSVPAALSARITELPRGNGCPNATTKGRGGQGRPDGAPRDGVGPGPAL